MILQIQSNDPVVTLQESEYFLLKHAKEAAKDQAIKDAEFITALLKDYATVKYKAGKLESAWPVEFRIPGYIIHTRKEGYGLMYQYEKTPE